jgi:transcriptional regulator with XRE-family HTH domain
LADRSGVQPSTIWRIEEGKTRDPASSTLRKLSDALAE